MHERRHSLLALLRKQPGSRVSELAKALGVSEGTIRNDLNALEEDGRLTRFHGGAVLREQSGLQNTSFSARHQIHCDEKRIIARYAAPLINDGDSIWLDASSTGYYLAMAIGERQGLRVITNGLDAARLLSKNRSNTVILIGGVTSQDGSSVTGLFSEQIIQELHIQKAFLSCSGFSLERGMTEVHLEEAQLKRRVIASANQLIAIIDSSKFGKEDLTPFARSDQVTHLLTDTGISAAWAQAIERAGISLTICQETDSER